MEGKGHSTVDAYIASFPEDVQEVLRTVRATIRAAAPDAEERMSYQMPAYKHHGWLCYFGAFTKHYSLFAVNSEGAVVKFGDRLARYKISKGTIQFPLTEPVPTELITDIVKLRMEENEAREAAKRG